MQRRHLVVGIALAVALAAAGCAGTMKRSSSANSSDQGHADGPCATSAARILV